MGHCSAVVATFRQRHTAELAQGFLVDADIQAVVSVDDAGFAYAGLTLGPHPARLLVRPDEAREARRVLAEAGMVEAEDQPAGEETEVGEM